MIEIKCEIGKVKKENGNRIANGYCRVAGKREDIVTELRIIFMQLEKATDELTFGEALNDWLTIEKGFKG